MPIASSAQRPPPDPTPAAARAPLEVLLLHDRPDRIAATVHDHIAALAGFSRHRVHPLSILGDLPDALDLTRFHAIVLHYTLVIGDDRYLSAAARARLAAAPAIKAVFIQDEYRHVDRTIAALRAIDARTLFTCVPEPEIARVYPRTRLPRLAAINVLTGYVDPALAALEVPPLARRPIDVGYRARKVPAWLGELGQEKYRIGARFLADAPRYDLRCDISHREEDRLYGPAWVRFLTRCKAVLGSESGASVFDFTGEVEAAVEADLARDPDLGYETLRDRHFKHLEGQFRLNQISPRCFEAVALRTLLILYEGDYSGRLEPWRHYVPLRKDHANMDEVAAALRDPARAQAIVDRAYAEVALAPRNAYTAMVAAFDQAIEENRPAAPGPTPRPYSAQELATLSRRAMPTRLRLKRTVATYGHLVVFRYLLGWLPAAPRDRLGRWLRRILRPIRRHLLG